MGKDNRGLRRLVWISRIGEIKAVEQPSPGISNQELAGRLPLEHFLN
jgi:hypothetical protein